MESKPFLSVQRHPSDNNLTDKRRRIMSHLPLLRYTTLSTVFIAIDSLLSISLWLAGGNTSYLEKNVEHFSLYKSTFDLACIAAIRGVVLIICLYYLEHYSLFGASTKYEDKQFVSQRLAKLCQIVFLLVSILSLIYAIIKGVLLLVHGSDVLNELHVTYKVLCVVGVVSPALEIVLGVSSFYFMWRLLHVHKLRLILNESETTKPHKKADLKRIAKLAIPEYPILSIGIIMLIISNGVQAVTPYFFGRVIDLAIRNETLCQEISNGVVNVTGDVPHCSLWPMNRTVLILVGLFGVAAVAGTFRNYLFTVAGERFVARLRKNLFSAIMRQEMGFFDKNRTGELTNRLASDTAVIQSVVTENISIMVRYTLQLVISLGIMFWISAKLTAVLLSVIPIIVIGAVHYGNYVGVATIVYTSLT